MPTTPSAYPGSPQHQALLRQIIGYYQDDPRVLAIVVLGSLGRGSWDALSDLDLDVVITDDARVRIEEELRALAESFAPLDERPAVIFAEEADEGEIVLESLMMLSIRYHPLADTNYNIVDSMRVLWGKLDHDTVAAAGTANRRHTELPLPVLLDKLVRYMAVGNVYFQRNFTWGAVEMLNTMRGVVMQIFARTHGGVRPFHTFQARADARIQARLAATLPMLDQEPLRGSMIAMLDLIEQDITAISNGALALTPGQKIVLERVREALA